MKTVVTVLEVVLAVLVMITILPPPTPHSVVQVNSGNLLQGRRWCRERDSNPHAVTCTAP